MERPNLSAFVAGELSPKLEGRTDLQSYYRGCSQLVNFLLMRQGGIRRRPGTIYAADAYAVSTGHASFNGYNYMRRHRLIPFVADEETGYALEATIEPNAGSTANTWRAFYNHSLAATFDVTTSVASIHNLQVVQVKNVMYMAARDMPPQKLTYNSAASWTCSAATYISGSVSLDTATNYPEAVTFQDDRLIYARDNTVWGSRVGHYTDFICIGSLASISADASFSYTMGGTKSAKILAMDTQEELVLFTNHGQVAVIGSQEAGIGPDITPLFKWRSSWGTESVQPIKFQDAIVFVQKGAMQIREFFWQDGWKSPELTGHADHMGGAFMALPDLVATNCSEWNDDQRGFDDIDIQQDPEPILWARRRDGKLASLVYDKSAGVAGWSRMETGGYPGAPDSANVWFGDGHVGSMCVIPNTDGEDELWLHTMRWTANASNIAYRSFIEYMAPSEYDNDADGHFVDCGIDTQVSEKRLVTDFGAATSSWTFQYQGGTDLAFVSGDTITFEDISQDSTWKNLNRTVFTIASIVTSVHTVASAPPTGAETETATATVSLGQVMKVAATANGLTHLEGFTVAVNLDGMAVADQVVSSGAISLPSYANRIHAGIPYTSKMRTMNLSAGLMSRITQVVLRVWKSLGGKIGNSETSTLAPIRIKTVGGDTVYGTEPHFSGDVVQEYPAGYTRAQYVYVQQDQPLPMYILSMIPTVHKYQKE